MTWDMTPSGENALKVLEEFGPATKPPAPRVTASGTCAACGGGEYLVRLPGAGIATHCPPCRAVAS